MALKGDRHEFETTIDFFMNEVAERGGIATLSTAGSGAAQDQSAALVTYAADPSGVQPIGLLLNDMVNKDLTRTHLNDHVNEMQQGGKVTLLKKGFVVTNRIDPGITVAAQNPAYVGPSGYITNVNTAYGRVVGTFESLKDEDGYAKVAINLPQEDGKSRADGTL
jgi:hypothetical protein